MFSKQLKRVLAVTASAVVVLGGTGAAMAAGSPVAAAGANTTYYACVLTAGSHQFFPWHALWNTSTSPVTCPRGEFSISWNQTGPQGPRRP
jgi:hypothetical protein